MKLCPKKISLNIISTRSTLKYYNKATRHVAKNNFFKQNKLQDAFCRIALSAVMRVNIRTLTSNCGTVQSKHTQNSGFHWPAHIKIIDCRPKRSNRNTPSVLENISLSVHVLRITSIDTESNLRPHLKIHHSQFRNKSTASSPRGDWRRSENIFRV